MANNNGFDASFDLDEILKKHALKDVRNSNSMDVSSGYQTDTSFKLPSLDEMLKSLNLPPISPELQPLQSEYPESKFPELKESPTVEPVQQLNELVQELDNSQSMIQNQAVTPVVTPIELHEEYYLSPKQIEPASNLVAEVVDDIKLDFAPTTPENLTPENSAVDLVPEIEQEQTLSVTAESATVHSVEDFSQAEIQNELVTEPSKQAVEDVVEKFEKDTRKEFSPQSAVAVKQTEQFSSTISKTSVVQKMSPKKRVINLKNWLIIVLVVIVVILIGAVIVQPNLSTKSGSSTGKSDNKVDSLIEKQTNLHYSGGIGYVIFLVQDAKVHKLSFKSSVLGGTFEVRSTSVSRPTSGDLIASGDLREENSVTFDQKNLSTLVIVYKDLPVGQETVRLSEVAVE